MATDRKFASITCVMPDCDAPLYVHWETTSALVLGDLDDPQPISPKDSDTSTWTVVCEEGHAILLPTSGGPDCCDGTACHCDVDVSDEYRTFRASDLGRLAALIERMGGGRHGD
jgi:hypothetical protein